MLFRIKQNHIRPVTSDKPPDALQRLAQLPVQIVFADGNERVGNLQDQLLLDGVVGVLFQTADIIAMDVQRENSGGGQDQQPDGVTDHRNPPSPGQLVVRQHRKPRWSRLSEAGC